MQAEKLELWKVASEVSSFFKINLIVYDDIKEKVISIEFNELDLKHTLEALAWTVGVEYIEKEGIYFLGGNSDNVLVLDSTGITADVTKIFGNKVYTIADKIVIQGTEREVKRISDALKKMQVKESCIIKVTGYEVSDDMLRKLGIDIDKAIRYSASWENILSSNFNPLQMSVVAVAMSVQAEEQGDKIKQVLNSYVGLVSGKESKIQHGESVDRQVYSSSTSMGTTLTTGYSTQQTGLIVTLEGFRYLPEEWNFNVNIENSMYISDTKKNLFNVKTSVLLKKGESILVGKMVKGSESVSIRKGIPWICEIPYLGYLFSVNTTAVLNKQILFFIEFVDERSVEAEKLVSEARQ